MAHIKSFDVPYVYTFYYVLIKTSIGKSRFPVTISLSLVLVSIPLRQPECCFKNTSFLHKCIAQTRTGNRKLRTCVSGLSLTNLDNVLTLEMALNLCLYRVNDDQDTANHILWLRRSHEICLECPSWSDMTLSYPDRIVLPPAQ